MQPHSVSHNFTDKIVALPHPVNLNLSNRILVWFCSTSPQYLQQQKSASSRKSTTSPTRFWCDLVLLGTFLRHNISAASLMLSTTSLTDYRPGLVPPAPTYLKKLCFPHPNNHRLSNIISLQPCFQSQLLQ